MSKQLKVIHVELTEPHDGKRHFYFGSKKAVTGFFSSDQIGISENYLRSLNITEQPYVNNKCTIRQGILMTLKKETR